MDTIPVLGFSGYSGSGKTTLIEALIPLLKRSGLRIAVIKHDGHDFMPDREGTDSYRFSDAGAAVSVVASAQKTALFAQQGADFYAAAALIRDVELILVEGFKQLPLTQIGLCRGEIPLPQPPQHYAAVVSDRPQCGASHVFRFDEQAALSAWILENRHAFTQLTIPPMPVLLTPNA